MSRSGGYITEALFTAFSSMMKHGSVRRLPTITKMGRWDRYSRSTTASRQADLLLQPDWEPGQLELILAQDRSGTSTISILPSSRLLLTRAISRSLTTARRARIV